MIGQCQALTCGNGISSNAKKVKDFVSIVEKVGKDAALHTPGSSDSFTGDVAAKAHENLADFYNIVEQGFLCLIFNEKEQLHNSQCTESQLRTDRAAEWRGRTEEGLKPTLSEDAF